MNSLIHISLYTLFRLFIFIMDEFTTDDNLYRLWQHIRPMNVFDHRPKVVSFSIRDYLVALMLGRQDVYKLCIFPYGFYTLLNQLERNLKALVLFYFVK